MKTIILIIFFSFCSIFGNDNSINGGFKKCLLKIIELYGQQDVFIIQFSLDVDIYLKGILNTFVSNNSVSLAKLQNYNHLYKFYLILMGNEILNLDEVLNILYNKQFLNPKAKYIVFYSGEEQLENIFQIAWRYNIVDIDVIKNNIFYTYFPYGKSNCSQNITSEIIGNCSYSINEMFPNKISGNLNGCVVNMLTLPYIPYVINISNTRKNPAEAGIEVTIMEYVSEKLNFTAAYSKELHETFLKHLEEHDYGYI